MLGFVGDDPEGHHRQDVPSQEERHQAGGVEERDDEDRDQIIGHCQSEQEGAQRRGQV